MDKFFNIKANSQIFVLTGAGISKESGIETFRDSNGLWNNHNVEDVATPEGFYRNPDLVYEFYNNRRKELNSGIKPNIAHIQLAKLEKYLKINIITQNIDNLHELAGSSNVIYMHGELNKARCIKNEQHVFKWMKNLTVNDKCNQCGSQMRPHIVWFGEMPFQMDEIQSIAENSDLFVSIGTSGEVYPAAGFVNMFKDMQKPTVELNLEPSRNQDLFDFTIHEPATIAVKEFKELILKKIK
tara:strand:- start:162 stop:884 length:723 start_codon:yes stop_codon:yes gene_type:complete